MDPLRELPLGLGMALAQNPQAMQRFASMSKEQQSQVVEHTHSIESKQEMQAYVNSFAGSDETRNALH